MSTRQYIRASILVFLGVSGVLVGEVEQLGDVVAISDHASKSAQKAQDILEKGHINIDPDRAAGDIAAQLRDNSIFKDIEQFVQRLRQRFLSFKTFPARLAQALKTSSFHSQTIDVTTKFGDGVSIDFGYPDVGDASEPYSGFDARVVVGDAPRQVQDVVEKSLAATPLKELLHGDHRVEFALKLALLLKGRFDKTMPLDDFIAYLHLTLYKMFNTPTFDSVNGVLNGAPSFVRKLINTLKIRGTSVVDYVDRYYQVVARLANFSFPRMYKNGSLVDNPKYSSYGKLSDAQARFVLMALCQKVLVYYTQMRSQFLQTSPGQIAFETYKRELVQATGAKKIKVHATFVHKIPQFRSLIIERFMVGEVARVFANLKNPQYKNAVGSVLNPLLNLIGLNFDDVLSLYDNTPTPPPAPPAMESASIEGDIDFEAEFNDFDDSSLANAPTDDWGDDVSWDDDFGETEHTQPTPVASSPPQDE